MLLTHLVAASLLNAIVVVDRGPLRLVQQAFQQSYDSCRAQQYPQESDFTNAVTKVIVTKGKRGAVTAALQISFATKPTAAQSKLKNCVAKQFASRRAGTEWIEVNQEMLDPPTSHKVLNDGNLGVQMAQLYVAEFAKPLLRVCKRKMLRLNIVVFPSGSIDTIDDSTDGDCVVKTLKRTLKFPRVDSATMLDVVVTP